MRLTEQDLREIDEGFRALGVEGARTSEQLAAQIDRGALLGTTSAGTHGNSPLPRHLEELNNAEA